MSQEMLSENARAQANQLCNDYLQQFTAGDSQKTQELVRHLEALGLTSAAECQQEHPSGGEALVQCLRSRGKIY